MVHQVKLDYYHENIEHLRNISMSCRHPPFQILLQPLIQCMFILVNGPNGLEETRDDGMRRDSCTTARARHGTG